MRLLGFLRIHCSLTALCLYPFPYIAYRYCCAYGGVCYTRPALATCMIATETKRDSCNLRAMCMCEHHLAIFPHANISGGCCTMPAFWWVSCHAMCCRHGQQIETRCAVLSALPGFYLARGNPPQSLCLHKVGAHVCLPSRCEWRNSPSATENCSCRMPFSTLPTNLASGQSSRFFTNTFEYICFNDCDMHLISLWKRAGTIRYLLDVQIPLSTVARQERGQSNGGLIPSIRHKCVVVIVDPFREKFTPGYCA